MCGVVGREENWELALCLFNRLAWKVFKCTNHLTAKTSMLFESDSFLWMIYRYWVNRDTWPENYWRLCVIQKIKTKYVMPFLALLHIPKGHIKKHMEEKHPRNWRDLFSLFCKTQSSLQTGSPPSPPAQPTLPVQTRLHVACQSLNCTR